MTGAILIALSNPISDEQEDAFNDWYDNIHVPEILEAPGINRATRYKVVAQTLPPGEEPKFSYLAIYEVDDAAQAVAAIEERMARFRMSDAFDLAGAIGFAFSPISVVNADQGR